MPKNIISALSSIMLLCYFNSLALLYCQPGETLGTQLMTINDGLSQRIITGIRRTLWVHTTSKL
jgi:hypothetical protein